MSNSKLLWVVIVLAVIMMGASIFGTVLVDKVSDRVILKLQKDYSPSPYGPGIDPDKLDTEKLNMVNVQSSNPIKAIQPVLDDGDWSDNWEEQRK